MKLNDVIPTPNYLCKSSSPQTSLCQSSQPQTNLCKSSPPQTNLCKSPPPQTSLCSTCNMLKLIHILPASIGNLQQ